MQQWEYLFVAAYPSHGTHRAQRINGRLLDTWEDGPNLYMYAQQLGNDGWELVSANTLPFMADELAYHLVFKRPQSADYAAAPTDDYPSEPEGATRRLR